MTPSKKLALGGLIIAGTTAYMAYLGAASSWQYYLTTDECLADRTKLGQTRLRVNGKIAAESLSIAADRRHADFALQGTDGRLTVHYHGPLPETLAVNIDLVVEGRLQGDVLQADKLITRCATKYRSEGQPPGARTAQQTVKDRR